MPQNRPDVNLATATDLAPKPDPNQPLLGGKFGLGAWNTQTEFKELRIYDEKDTLVYSDDFKSLENWDTPGIGTWRVENGVLQQTDKGKAPAMLFLKAFNLEKGRVTLKARRVGGAEGFLMLFNAESPDRFPVLQLRCSRQQLSPPSRIAVFRMAAPSEADAAHKARLKTGAGTISAWS